MCRYGELPAQHTDDRCGQSAPTETSLAGQWTPVQPQYRMLQALPGRRQANGLRAGLDAISVLGPARQPWTCHFEIEPTQCGAVQQQGKAKAGVLQELLPPVTKMRTSRCLSFLRPATISLMRCTTLSQKPLATQLRRKPCTAAKHQCGGASYAPQPSGRTVHPNGAHNCSRSGDDRSWTWCTNGRVVAHHLPRLGGCTAYQACTDYIEHASVLPLTVLKRMRVSTAYEHLLGTGEVWHDRQVRSVTLRSASTLRNEAVPRKDNTTVSSFQAISALVSSLRSHSCKQTRAQVAFVICSTDTAAQKFALLSTQLWPCTGTGLHRDSRLQQDTNELAK